MAELANQSQEKKGSSSTKSTSQNNHVATGLPSIDAINPQLLTTGGVLHLQRTIGNAAVQRIISQQSSPRIQREDTPASSTSASQYELNNFVHNEANLTGEHSEQLKKFADEIKKTLSANPEATITIVGHTDATGTEQVNFKIGQSRANNVRDALVNAGVSNEQIIAVLSKGKSSLKVQTEAKEGQNRRVEIKLNGVSNTAPAPAPTPTPGTTETPNNDTPSPGTPPKPENKDKPKEEEKKLKPTAKILLVPYKYEVKYAPGKDPEIKHKAVIEGELGIEYMLTEYDSGKLKLEIPAELMLGMMGAYDYKDKKFELKGEVKLGVGVEIKQTPFTGDILKNLYFKQGVELSLKGASSGEFAAEGEGKVGVGYKLGPVKLELMGKGSLEFNSKEKQLEKSLSGQLGLGVEF